MTNTKEIAKAVRIALENQLDPMGHDSKELEKLIFDTINKLLPTEEEERIERARYYLSESDDMIMEGQVALIDAQAEIDDSVMLDDIDGIMVWEKVEYSLSVRDFLDMINH